MAVIAVIGVVASQREAPVDLLGEARSSPTAPLLGLDSPTGPSATFPEGQAGLRMASSNPQVVFYRVAVLDD